MRFYETLPALCLAALVLLVPVSGRGGTLEEAARGRIIAAAGRLVGTTEKTGRNDGPVIDEILATVGLQGTGSPYCAAFNRWAYDQAGLKKVGPRSAWSPDWLMWATWTQKSGGKTPLPGDTWGLAWTVSEKGKPVFRVRHTGLTEQWRPPVVLTIEGNTAPEAKPMTEADRNGDGIWRKRRLVRQIYAVQNHIDPRR